MRTVLEALAVWIIAPFALLAVWIAACHAHAHAQRLARWVDRQIAGPEPDQLTVNAPTLIAAKPCGCTLHLIDGHETVIPCQPHRRYDDGLQPIALDGEPTTLHDPQHAPLHAPPEPDPSRTTLTGSQHETPQQHHARTALVKRLDTLATRIADPHARTDPYIADHASLLLHEAARAVENGTPSFVDATAALAGASSLGVMQVSVLRADAARAERERVLVLLEGAIAQWESQQVGSFVQASVLGQLRRLWSVVAEAEPFGDSSAAA